MVSFKKLFYYYFCFSFACSLSAQIKPFSLAHQINIGGNFSLPLEINRYNEFQLKLQTSPHLGYFINEAWELRATLNFKYQHTINQQESLSHSPLFWDLSSQVFYYFRLSENIRPFIGSGLGVGFMDLNIYSLHIIFDIPIGIMFQLNKNFAFDIGIPFRIRMSMRSLADKIQFPVAFLGMRYFF
ncbi:MAG: hypothetical protein KC505_05220 [Myxococcales bacterium]|nr:hypothetical protein [Myxococcales bacterium]USN51194.1 MAG: hypothetical protein H6731_01945 [Myxococcales bacterium]